MASIITILTAFDNWNSEVKPHVIAAYGPTDHCALAESWNEYTDALNKNGELNALQYHFCPSWDDEMPDDDGEFLLERMGVEMKATRIVKRSDNAANWPAGASHWSCFIRRVGTGKYQHTDGFAVEYSMGSAHRGSPELADVFGCLLSDSDSVDQPFEDWADELGYDTDSRAAEATYNACKETAAKLAALFSKSELADLREVFADR